MRRASKRRARPHRTRPATDTIVLTRLREITRTTVSSSGRASAVSAYQDTIPVPGPNMGSAGTLSDVQCTARMSCPGIWVMAMLPETHSAMETLALGRDTSAPAMC
jgi:hypothetical protein